MKIKFITFFLLFLKVALSQNSSDSVLLFGRFDDNSISFYDSLNNLLKMNNAYTQIMIMTWTEDSVLNVSPEILPEILFSLKRLKILTLYGSFYPLSSSIKELKSLKEIEIKNSNGHNILPPAIKELQNLKSLEVYGIDTVIPEICELENLEYLLLYGTYSTLPENIGDLKNLKELRIMSPNLKELPESFAELDSLEQLSFEFWEAESIPKEICQLKSLKVLRFLFSEKITKFPRCLSKLPNIEKIMIYNSYTNKQKEHIYRLFKNRDVEVELF